VVLVMKQVVEMIVGVAYKPNRVLRLIQYNEGETLTSGEMQLETIKAK
jgi:hypothetical protein